MSASIVPRYIVVIEVIFAVQDGANYRGHCAVIHSPFELAELLAGKIFGFVRNAAIVEPCVDFAYKINVAAGEFKGILDCVGEFRSFAGTKSFLSGDEEVEIAFLRVPQGNFRVGRAGIALSFHAGAFTVVQNLGDLRRGAEPRLSGEPQ